MSSPWILTHGIEQHDRIALPTAADRLADYLDRLSATDRAAFDHDTLAICAALREALLGYIETHPTSGNPWLLAGAAYCFAAAYEHTLETLIAELDTDAAADDCDA